MYKSISRNSDVEVKEKIYDNKLMHVFELVAFVKLSH